MNRALMANAIHNAGNTLKRFWATFLYALVSVIASITLVENKTTFSLKSVFENLSFTAVLGIGLSIAITLFSERSKHSSATKKVLQVLGMILIGIYYFSLPEKWSSFHFLRAGLLIVSLHCLVAFAAFIKKGAVEGFWQFNKILFIHILISLLYTTVLFLGISLAIVVVNHLFSLKIASSLYSDLWLFLIGIFNTWFFLSGVPSDFDELDHRTDYPKGLKIFTQFVLIPLVTIYFVILYAYMTKMIFQWSLPKGAVSFLVVGFSVFGILSLLLIYPLQNLDTEKWIKIYSRWFYRALLPLIVLLFVAIGTRIGNYGITESRYLIVLLALWLAGISIYLQINKLHNIKIIPITLCLITALSAFGPWGAAAVSKSSQLGRLKSILTRNELLLDGKLKKPAKEIPQSDQNELSSLISYLSYDHGAETLTSFFSPKDKKNIAQEMKDFLKVIHVDSAGGFKRFYFSIPKPPGNAYLVKGNDYFFERSYSIYNGAFNEAMKADQHNFSFSSDSKKLTVSYKGQDMVLEFRPIYEKLKKLYKRQTENSVSEADMTYVLENREVSFKIVFTYIGGSTDQAEGGFKFESLDLRCFIKLKSE